MLPLPSSTTLTGMWSTASRLRARFPDPDVTVVASVPSAGPVPPPMIVVMPDASASSTICGQIGCALSTTKTQQISVKLLTLVTPVK